jgi:conjugative transfer pilus assembly protein TraH
MKTGLKKSYLAVLLASSSLFISPASQAEMKGFATQAWGDIMSDARVRVAGASTVETSSATGYMGGSGSIRLPRKKVELYRITAPRLNAGCNGIDWNFGAVSMINGEELVKAGKAVMEGIPMYAFSLAINSLCNTCEAQLQELVRKLNKFSSLAKDSCQLSKSLVDSTVGGAISENARKLGGGLGLDSGLTAANNWASNSIFSDYKESTDAGAEETLKKMPQDVKKALEGNLVWQSILKSDSTLYLAGSESQRDKEILMSLIGTVVGTISADGEPSEAILPATLKAKSFIYGTEKEANAVFISCGSDVEKCASPTLEELSSPIPSLVEKVEETIDSITQKYFERNVQFTQEERAFIDAGIDPLDTYGLISHINERSKVKSLDLRGNAELIAKYIVYQLIDEVYENIETALSNRELTGNFPEKIIKEYIAIARIGRENNNENLRALDSQKNQAKIQMITISNNSKKSAQQ